MPRSLLDSQLDILEPLQDDEWGVLVDLTQTLDDIVQSIKKDLADRYVGVRGTTCTGPQQRGPISAAATVYTESLNFGEGTFEFRYRRGGQVTGLFLTWQTISLPAFELNYRQRSGHCAHPRTTG